MTPRLWHLRLVAYAVQAAMLAACARWIGPDLEVALAPVVVDQRISAIARLQPGLACWTWGFGKARAAVGEDAGWTIRVGARVWPYQRVMTIADSAGEVSALPRRAVGPGHWTRKCIDVPPELWGQPFALTGFVEYRTALTGRLWSVRQPTLGLDVP